jgi:hypothetical protein
MSDPCHNSVLATLRQTDNRAPTNDDGAAEAAPSLTINLKSPSAR